MRHKNYYLLDMDGVIYHGNQLLPKVKEFITFLQKTNVSFLFITNASDKSPKQLQMKLERMGISVGQESFLTAALNTARFVSLQKPHGSSAFVIGQEGLLTALHNVGCQTEISEQNTVPDFVIIGETDQDQLWNYSNIKRAVNYVLQGSLLIGTNADVLDRLENNVFGPGTGSLVASIEAATNKKAYYLGKPNSLMMQHAHELLGYPCKSEMVLIGDRMDTDIRGSMEFGIDSILVLSGIAKESDLKQYSFTPTLVMSGIDQVYQSMQN